MALRDNSIDPTQATSSHLHIHWQLELTGTRVRRPGSPIFIQGPGVAKGKFRNCPVPSSVRVTQVLGPTQRLYPTSGNFQVFESRESETIQHTLFECTAFEEEREVFLSKLYSVCPIARQLDDEYRCRLVMGDRLPREIENPFKLYRYLSAISRLRLGILTEQGEGS